MQELKKLPVGFENFQEIPPRLLRRPLHDLFIDSVTLAGPGRSEIET